MRDRNAPQHMPPQDGQGLGKDHDYGYQQDLTPSGRRRSQNWEYGADEVRFDRYQDQSLNQGFGRNYTQDFGRRNFSRGYDESFGQADRQDHSYAESYPHTPQEGYQGRHGYSEEEHARTGAAVSPWNRPSVGDRNWVGNTQQPPFRGPQNPQVSHSGKGPKGFKRSDESLKEEISLMLTRHHEVDASDVEIEVLDGEVTLTGFVPERRMKHLTEDLVVQCLGVKDVINNMRVKKYVEDPTSDKEADLERTSKAAKKNPLPSH